MAETTDTSSVPENLVSTKTIAKTKSPKKEEPSTALEPENESKTKLMHLDVASLDEPTVSTSYCDESSQDSPADSGQPQFYIEVDATAVANLKMGTQYTLVPVDQARPISEVEISGSQDSTCSIEDTKDNTRWESLETVPEALESAASKALEASYPNGSGDAANSLSFSEPSILNLSGSVTNCGSQHHHGIADHNAKNLSYTPLLPLSHMSHHQMSMSRFDSSRHQHHPMGSTPPVPSGFSMVPTPLHPSRIYGPGAPMLNPISHSSSTHTRSMHHQPLNHSWSPYGQQNYSGQSYHSGMLNLNSSSSVSGTPSSGNGSNISLSGSGDEVDHNTDYSRMNMSGMQQMVGPLDNIPYYMPFNGRENHNEKERKRRSRIKNACQTLRTLVPGLSEKTDKATVFEFTVQYMMHLKRNTGPKYDKDFMEKYSPY